jgi:hypothetical protein
MNAMVIISTKLMALVAVLTLVMGVCTMALVAAFATPEDNSHHPDNSSMSVNVDRSNYTGPGSMYHDQNGCSNDTADTSAIQSSEGGDDDAGTAGVGTVQSSDCYLEQSQVAENNTYLKDYGDDYLDITGFIVNPED